MSTWFFVVIGIICAGVGVALAMFRCVVYLCIPFNLIAGVFIASFVLSMNLPVSVAIAAAIYVVLDLEIGYLGGALIRV